KPPGNVPLDSQTLGWLAAERQKNIPVLLWQRLHRVELSRVADRRHGKRHEQCAGADGGADVEEQQVMAGDCAPGGVEQLEGPDREQDAQLRRTEFPVRDPEYAERVSRERDLDRQEVVGEQERRGRKKADVSAGEESPDQQ